MPEISVIVPVYNTKDYLPRCLDSILSQTFKDFEIILIDDGSKDESGKICDEYKLKDNRISVIHKENEGVSTARNCGLEKARGKYIMFCDSDDYVENNWIEILYKNALKYKNSLPGCEFTLVDVPLNKKTLNRLPLEPYKIYKNDMYYVLYKHNYSNCLYCRIYENDVIKSNNLRFLPDKRSGEDVLFNIEYLKHCDGFVYIPICLYYYMNNGTGSITHSYDSHYFDIVADLYFPRKELIAEKYAQEFYDEYFFRFYDCLKIAVDDRSEMSRKEQINYCNYILKHPAFKDVLENTSEAGCSSLLKKVLNTGSYRFLEAFNLFLKLKSKK